ncbi:SLBB domain-containing protein [Porticoccaceae bacterium]|nr:SLBB domain-containing protein [Porticoccaceae bacterium]
MNDLIRNRIGLAAILLCWAVGTLSQEGLNDARRMCSDMTEKDIAMAKAAGYDVEKLCRGVSSIEAKEVSETQDTDGLFVPRRTISSPNNFDQDQGGEALPEQKDGKLTDNFPWVWNDSEKSWEAKGEELKPYGYDLFANESTTFAPETNIPVSADYLLGPGDSLEVLLFGKTNNSHSIEINRNGIVDFPGLGPVGLAGLTFVEAKEMIKTRISAQMIGVEASISMGALRTMQVFVLGEAYRPGAYTVSSLATITHALFSSGGVSDIASLRNIQLKRAGQLVTVLDLYDLLMSGDTSNDMRLQASDVIYIPTVGDMVSVSGEVRRPAIYEIKSKTSVQGLLDLAGGLKAKAFSKNARIDRLDSDGFMTVVDVNLSAGDASSQLLKAGDHLTVDSVVEAQKNVVSLVGYVHRPGEFSWWAGMRVSDLVKSLDQFPKKLDLNFALLTRERSPAGEIETLRIDLESVLTQPGSKEDVHLKARDIVQVFALDGSRKEGLEETLLALQAQSRSGGLPEIVSVAGSVKFAGTYPLTKGMTLAHLVEAAGGLGQAVYSDVVEISRADLAYTDRVNYQVYAVDLAEEMQLGSEGFLLRPYDSVTLRVLSEFRSESKVELKGEVRLPGVYDFERGETLREVIDRAGGFTDLAFLDAAIFTRDSLRKEEERQLRKLKKDMLGEIDAKQVKAIGVKAPDAQGTDEARQALLASFDSTEATGRLVIDLPGIIDGSVADIPLRSGDVLRIPEFRPSVAVIGQVYQPVVFTFDPKLGVTDYLSMAGGLREDADQKAIYVIKASGAVDIPRRRLLSFAGQPASIEAGDTIVVPLRTEEELSGLPLVTKASQIIYQLSLGAAALNQLNRN